VNLFAVATISLDDGSPGDCAGSESKGCARGTVVDSDSDAAGFSDGAGGAVDGVVAEQPDRAKLSAIALPRSNSRLIRHL
jgi:hypothetical protein